MAATIPGILVLDAGTSAGKAAVFDLQGQLLALAARPWHYTSPPEAAPWGREFDPAAFWRCLAEAAREVLSLSASEVLAIAATAQRQATILLDKDGRELYSGPNVDLRACFEGARLLSEQGERLHAITGHLPPMMFASARWLWFRQRRPEIIDSTHKLLMMSDWLLWRLCGCFLTDPANAAETGFYDVGHLRWSEELLRELELPPAILPKVATPGIIAGELGTKVARELGLEPGLPVVLASADTPCGTLGLGCTGPGQAAIVAGWSAPVQAITATPLFDGERQLWTSPALLPGRWSLEGNCGPAGSAHRWLRDTVFAGESYAEMEKAAASVSPGAGGALSFLGPRVADYARPQMLWGGLLFPQANDLWPVGRAELARAALENIAFALRANLERVTNVSGRQPDSVACGGGLTRSRLFNQILADVLGIPVAVSDQYPVSALGAAACAAAASKHYSGLEEAAKNMNRAGNIYTPVLAAQAEYLDLYERWLQAYRFIEEISTQIV